MSDLPLLGSPVEAGSVTLRNRIAMVPMATGKATPEGDVTPELAEHYAARFAAREAVLKALGTGFSEGIGFKDVSVTNDEWGKPIAVLSGRAAEVAAERGVQEVALSLSHTRDVAVANAVLVTEDVRPKVEERQDPAQELLASFKAARTVIDELERQQLSLFDRQDS